MPATTHPDLDELDEIARRLCFFASELAGMTAPTTRSVAELRHFARQLSDRLESRYCGLRHAILVCAEEIADHPVRADRVEGERLLRRAIRTGQVIPSDFSRLMKSLLDYPFEYRDPRVLVLRAPARIRLVKALGETTRSHVVIAKATEPFLERSKARTLARVRTLGCNTAQAKSHASSQARGTVLKRLRAKSTDRYVVFGTETEAPAILQAWARNNGYSVLDTEPLTFFTVIAKPRDERTLAETARSLSRSVEDGWPRKMGTARDISSPIFSDGQRNDCRCVGGATR
jgi:hypothetical protein